MAIIVGQIEPLKKLKATFASKGILRFNSIGDIRNFTKNYEAEKAETPALTKKLFDKEIELLEEQLSQAVSRSQRNAFTKLFYYFKVRRLTRKRKHLKTNYDSVLESKTVEALISLDFIRDTVEDLSPIIAGAIGENQTVKEIQKLPDDYYLINDFSIKFEKPIYNRREDDRIYSIQIDHLLVSKAGIFLIETKNWSKKSLENYDLRSPVKQVGRTSYALFVLLNGNSEFDLVSHHWGGVKIPIKNIIAMTKHKPMEPFKHVSVLTLDELNGYIQYFDDIFTNDETKHIFNYLCKLNNE